MSTNRRNGAGDASAPRAAWGDEGRAEVAGRQLSMHGDEARSQSSGGGGSRRKRRRQRQQRGKRPGLPMPVRSPRAAVVEVGTRERIFQDVEGLLRQIREEAEETETWSEEQLRDITQAVTTFTKSLEQESDPISDRVRLNVSTGARQAESGT